MMNRGKPKSRVISTSITILVIFLVIMAGPGAAITATVSVSSESVAKGDLITFTATVLINKNERAPIRDFQLNIAGPTMTKNCTFYTNGTVKSGCTGITNITMLSGGSIPYTSGNTTYNDSVYGYSLGIGYGYGLGTGTKLPLYNFTYHITINTSSYSAALTPYSATLYAILSNDDLVRNVSSNEINFNITYTNSSTEEVIPEDEDYEVTNESQTIVIIPGTDLDNITISSNITENESITMDLSNTFDQDNSSIIENNLTITRSGNTTNFTVIMPGNLTITPTNASWDGTFILPTIKETADFTPPNGSTSVVVEVGVPGIKLNFDKAVKIVIEGMAGKAAFWNDGTSTYAIGTVCNGAANPTNVPAGGECYISSGNDLIIWTYHFSVFGAYTPAEAEEEETTTTSSGGGGGSGWTTYYISDENFEEGVDRLLKKNQRLRVYVDEESHYVGIADLTTTTATISVSSTTQEVDFAIGDDYKFEVTDDNYYDIYVVLNDIEDNKADITIRKIHEMIPEDEQEQEDEEDGVVEIFCGDGVCAGTVENCESCAADCACEEDRDCVDGECVAGASSPVDKDTIGPETLTPWKSILLPIILIMLVVLVVAFFVFKAEHKHH